MTLGKLPETQYTFEKLQRSFMSYLGNIKKSLFWIHTIGNGICDGDANIGGACEFDGGDCCQPIIDNSGCTNETCLCYDDWSLHFTLAGKRKFQRKSICLRFIYFLTSLVRTH